MAPGDSATRPRVRGGLPLPLPLPTACPPAGGHRPRKTLREAWYAAEFLEFRASQRGDILRFSCWVPACQEWITASLFSRYFEAEKAEEVAELTADPAAHVGRLFEVKFTTGSKRGPRPGYTKEWFPTIHEIRRHPREVEFWDAADARLAGARRPASTRGGSRDPGEVELSHAAEVSAERPASTGVLRWDDLPRGLALSAGGGGAH